LRGREGDGDELDLGAFIAELRAELLALRRGEDRRPLSVSERPPPPDPAALVQALPRAPDTVSGLLEGPAVPRPHRTLLLACGTDLDSALPSLRLRAVERLTEARLFRLTPLVARRMEHEPDPRVRTAMVRHVAMASPEMGREALARMRADADPRVRAAAVDALSVLDPAAAAAAVDDPAPAVRRRALARLPRTAAAVDRLADALHDPDGSVRRVALLTLAGHDSPAARAVLEAAAAFPDESLSALARAALGRDRGLPPDPPLDEEPLAAAVEQELRSSLRGRSPDELEERLAASGDRLGQVVGRLLAAGRLIRRGSRLYIP
jgi:HEAT repeat protein